MIKQYSWYTALLKHFTKKADALRYFLFVCLIVYLFNTLGFPAPDLKHETTYNCVDTFYTIPTWCLFSQYIGHNQKTRILIILKSIIHLNNTIAIAIYRNSKVFCVSFLDHWVLYSCIKWSVCQTKITFHNVSLNGHDLDIVHNTTYLGIHLQ